MRKREPGSSGAPAFIIGNEMEDARRCPRCHSDEVIPISYGMPTEEAVEESRRGEIALGGCLVWPEAPEWLCRACGYEWREDEAGL